MKSGNPWEAGYIPTCALIIASACNKLPISLMFPLFLLPISSGYPKRRMKESSVHKTGTHCAFALGRIFKQAAFGQEEKKDKKPMQQCGGPGVFNGLETRRYVSIVEQNSFLIKSSWRIMMIALGIGKVAFHLASSFQLETLEVNAFHGSSRRLGSGRRYIRDL